MLNSHPRNNTAAELCSGEFNEANCRNPEWKLPTPPPVEKNNKGWTSQN
jgi:hypothetical protein